MDTHRLNLTALSSDVQQVEAAAAALSADLAKARSATLWLEALCGRRLSAASVVISIERIYGANTLATAEQCARLEVASPADVEFRRVKLCSGGVALSLADNWFVPSRLTAEMRALLDETDQPFGAVIAALQPMRFTQHTELASIVAADQADAPLFQHRALVRSGTGQTLAEVHETYLASLLGFV